LGANTKVRVLAIVAVVVAVIALLLLASDAVVHDWAMIFGALGLLAAAGVLGILLIPANMQTDDVWAKVAWGKLFVALVYASIAVASFVTMAHTPDAARFVHAMRAAL